MPVQGTDGSIDATKPALWAGDARELDALENGAGVRTLEDHGGLLLTGEDRVDFLHGQVANDVKGLQAGALNDSLLLNHKGHALAQLRVLRGEGDLRVITEGNSLDTVHQSLDSHIIFDQVKLEKLDGHLTVTVQGPRAPQVLEEALGIVPQDGRWEWIETGETGFIVAPSRRTGAGGFDIYTDQGSGEELVQRLVQAGALQVGRASLEVARVEARIPTAWGEGGLGVLPQEAGLEPLLSYRKGCYLGQEIMARIEARGNLRRGLELLQLEGTPEGGDRKVRSEGKLVGQLGSTVRHPERGVLGLAIVRNDLQPEATVEVAGVAGRVVPAQ